MEEIWKEIDNTQGKYFISNMGNVISLKNHKKTMLSGCVFNNGYRFYNINGKHCTAHRLVALAFIPKSDIKNVVNHKDGNKLNNNVSNLEWCTLKENIQHAFRTGIMDNAIKQTGKNKIRAKIIGRFDLEGNFLDIHKGSVVVGKQLGICARNIRSVCVGNRKTAGGYIWKYLDGYKL